MIDQHSSALSFQDACIAAAQEIPPVPIDKDKHMIQIQKKRQTNTCMLNIFARRQSNTNTYLVHCIEKS